MAFCKNCGISVEEGIPFCPSCGSAVDAGSQPQFEGTQQQPQQVPFQAQQPQSPYQAPYQAQPQQQPQQQGQYQTPYQAQQPQQPYQAQQPQQGQYQAPYQAQQPQQQQGQYHQAPYQAQPPQQGPYQSQSGYNTPPSMSGAPLQADAQDAKDNKSMGVLAYILFFIPLLTGAYKTSPFVKFHTNQGTVLFIGSFALSVAVGILRGILSVIFGRIAFFLGISSLANLILLAPLAFCIMGIINAVNGTMKPLPLIGEMTIIK